MTNRVSKLGREERDKLREQWNQRDLVRREKWEKYQKILEAEPDYTLIEYIEEWDPRRFVAG